MTPYNNFERSYTIDAYVQPMDPREHRRKRDRDRYAQMSAQQKEELLKRRRESYQRKKTTMASVANENQLQGNIDK